MIDRAEVERAAELFRAPDGSFERLLLRRDRKRRNQRIGAGALAIVIALVSFVAMTRAFRNSERPAIEPTPKPPGMFSKVGGWIAYGNQWGIWALDPSDPNRESQVRLSSVGGTPLEWSSDGSELLVSRESWDLLSRRELIHGEEAPASRLGLFVLHADGTETHLFRGMVSGASFSPDGTTVVFAPSLELRRWEDDRGIYRIDADGGVLSRLQVEPRRIYFPDQGRSFRTELYFPTFSPDGTQIAFFDGFGDNSHSLRVVNADGSDLQVLIDNIEGYRITNLVWSPDGKTLAFGRRINDGVYTIGVDGLGLTLVIPGGENPHWSPDGSHIWYEVESGAGRRRDLYVADRDGTHVQSVAAHAASGPLNPLVQPEPEIAEVPAASERVTPTWMFFVVVAVLVLLAGVVLTRRRTRRNAGTAV